MFVDYYLFPRSRIACNPAFTFLNLEAAEPTNFYIVPLF